MTKRFFIISICALIVSSCSEGSPTSNKSRDNRGAKPSPASSSLKRPIDSAGFFGQTNAWVVTGGKDLIHTDDEGKNWEKVNKESVGGFECTSFIDSTTGWTINDRGQLWRSRDGGRNWTLTASIDRGRRFVFDQMKFEDEHTGWLMEPFSIWRTTDGGLNWIEREFDTPLADACFLNSDAAWVFDQDNRLFLYACYGGNQPQLTYIPGQSGDDNLRAAYCLDGKTGWIARGNGSPDVGHSRLYYTGDHAKTWKMYKVPVEKMIINSIYFINDDLGWIAGSQKISGSDDEFTGVLMYTLDGGQSWKMLRTGVQDLGYSVVYFADALTGWLIGYDKVYHTANGGSAWTVVLSLE